jgi:hypothetical protein
MGKMFDGIDGKLAAWIGRQPLFFVATAPLAADGHVNVSPKGPISSLHLLGPREVAYVDRIGSGAETAAHLRENGRIVIMLCAFDGPPRIVRLHGRGEVYRAGSPGWDGLRARLGEPGPPSPGERAIVRVDVERIADSCGYGVPLMDVRGERPQYGAWLDHKVRTDASALDDYVAERNAESIDGLGAFDAESR